MGSGKTGDLFFVVTETHGLRHIQTAGVRWNSDRRGSLTTASEPLGVDVNGRHRQMPRLNRTTPVRVVIGASKRIIQGRSSGTATYSSYANTSLSVHLSERVGE